MPSFKYYRLFNIGIAILLGLSIVYLNVYYADFDYWSKWKNYELAETYLCEQIKIHSFIRQPLNTFSNVLYFYFALEIFRFSIKDYKTYHLELPNLLKANFQYSVFFALSMFLIFSVSCLYHASMLHVFLRFDMMGVFVCVFLPALYSLHKYIQAVFYKNKPSYSLGASSILFMGLVVCVYFCSVYLWNAYSYYIIGLVLSSMIALNIFYCYHYTIQHNATLLFVSIFSSAVAVLFYLLDYYYCDSHSWLQLHSLWHLFSAVSMFYFYLYMRTEQHKVMA